MIDLRSDTVTRPTAAMRRAMAEAEVGDDVFGEDPTVRRLEETVASLLGKEAGLFVPSGVMGNQIAIKVHTSPGDEVVVAERSHIYHYESGAPGLISGVQLHPVPDPAGRVSADALTAALRGAHDWEPRTRLVCLENTVNKAGGLVYPIEEALKTTQVAREHGLALHLDGARLWNAAAATGLPLDQLTEPFATANVCLSKGLGAPVGSVLVGSTVAIRQARRIRKLLGGGMRQVGVLAAAGLLALEHRHDLHRDHALARALAVAAAQVPGCRCDPDAVETNIVLIETERPAVEVTAALAGHEVLVVPFGAHTLRATTHRDVPPDAPNRLLDALRAILT